MIITRYVLKNLFGVTVFVTVVLTLLIMLTQSLRFLELIIETGAPGGIFFQLMALAVPRFLTVILPLAMVTAVLFIYNKMIAENEMIVLRAAGATQRRLMAPALGLGLAGFFIMIFLTMWGAPASHAQLESLRNEVQTAYAGLLLREGVFNTVDRGLMIYTNERLSNGILSGLIIHDSRAPDTPPVTIIAASGHITAQTMDDAQVVVYDGKRQNYNRETGTLDILNFQQYTVRVSNMDNAPQFRWKKEDERTIFELVGSEGGVTARGKDIKTLFHAEIHRRVTASLTVFSFIMIALAWVLGGSFNRRGQSRRTVMAAGTVILFQSLYLALANALEDKAWAMPVLYLGLLLPVIAALYLLSPAGHALQRRFSQKQRGSA